MNKTVQPQWLEWAKELQFIAQGGLTYSKDVFDIERFERIREIAAEMLSLQSEIPIEKVKNLFCNETGFQTPKLDTRAAIFKDDKILLVKEKNESSRFVKDPKTMNKEILKAACDKLGWTYKVQGEDLIVTDAKQKEKVYGEYVLRVSGSTVTYNSYYLSNGGQLVADLQSVFFPLNVEYARKTVVDAFKKKGFTLKKLYDFAPTAEEVDRFCMVGYTKLEDEKEKRYEIKFSILNDGTVVTDSNYLPDDVNERAHAAMDDLQEAFGNKRIMTKKPEYDIMIARLKEQKKITNKNTQTIK